MVQSLYTPMRQIFECGHKKPMVGVKKAQDVTELWQTRMDET